MPSIDSTRWMAFVDGENLTIRAQNHPGLQAVGLETRPTHYLRDVFIWMPHAPHESAASLFKTGFPLSGYPTRAYYYTSVVGDELKLLSVRESLRALEFDPQVFKKDQASSRSKGVDITLTKDMLAHAFFNNYDAALLVAGDGDYVPLVQEVKRLGKNVFVLFFQDMGLGLAKELRLIADRFVNLSDEFVHRWKTLPA